MRTSVRMWLFVLMAVCLVTVSGCSKIAESQYNSGLRCEKEEKLKQSIFHYRIAAKLGHAKAQYSLGYCYYFGRGVEKDDKESAYWFRKAADQGHEGGKIGLELLSY